MNNRTSGLPGPGDRTGRGSRQAGAGVFSSPEGPPSTEPGLPRGVARCRARSPLASARNVPGWGPTDADTVHWDFNRYRASRRFICSSGNGTGPVPWAHLGGLSLSVQRTPTPGLRQVGRPGPAGPKHPGAAAHNSPSPAPLSCGH